MKLNWTPAPRKTEWGDMMVVATVELDRDHTLDLYCEAESTHLVEAALKRLATAMSAPTRFDQDMDGSMEPSEHGRWVRFDDVSP